MVADRDELRTRWTGLVSCPKRPAHCAGRPALQLRLTPLAHLDRGRADDEQAADRDNCSRGRPSSVRTRSLKRDWNRSGGSRRRRRASMSSTRMATTVCTRTLDSITPRHSPGSRLRIGHYRRHSPSARSSSMSNLVQLFRQLPRIHAGIAMLTAAKRCRHHRPSGAWRIPCHEDYDTWRDVTDFASRLGPCEELPNDFGQLRHPPRNPHRASGKRAVWINAHAGAPRSTTGRNGTSQ